MLRLTSGQAAFGDGREHVLCWPRSGTMLLHLIHYTDNPKQSIWTKALKAVHSYLSLDSGRSLLVLVPTYLLTTQLRPTIIQHYNPHNFYLRWQHWLLLRSTHAGYVGIMIWILLWSDLFNRMDSKIGTDEDLMGDLDLCGVLHMRVHSGRCWIRKNIYYYIIHSILRGCQDKLVIHVVWMTTPVDRAKQRSGTRHGCSERR